MRSPGVLRGLQWRAVIDLGALLPVAHLLVLVAVIFPFILISLHGACLFKVCSTSAFHLSPYGSQISISWTLRITTLGATPGIDDFVSEVGYFLHHLLKGEAQASNLMRTQLCQERKNLELWRKT
jgi:hypothetical protein